MTPLVSKIPAETPAFIIELFASFFTKIVHIISWPGSTVSTIDQQSLSTINNPPLSWSACQILYLATNNYLWFSASSISKQIMAYILLLDLLASLHFFLSV